MTRTLNQDLVDLTTPPTNAPLDVKVRKELEVPRSWIVPNRNIGPSRLEFAKGAGNSWEDVK